MKKGPQIRSLEAVALGTAGVGVLLVVVSLVSIGCDATAPSFINDPLLTISIVAGILSGMVLLAAAVLSIVALVKRGASWMPLVALIAALSVWPSGTLVAGLMESFIYQ